MKLFSIRFLGLAAAFFAASIVGAVAQAEDWVSYHNNQFGYRFLYPANVFQAKVEAPNSEGPTFTSADGRSKLTVFAALNTENIGIGEYRETILRDFAGYDRIDYGPKGQSWFVLSGLRSGTVYYQKVLYACEGRIINVFSLTYPEEQKTAFDSIVTGIEKSFFTASGGGCAKASRH